MVFGSGTKIDFHDYVQGTWGTFCAPSGPVAYLMTKARLGDESADPERRLTKSLAPVREVMESGSLDFNQLLQRDLDDHRVATSLVPYLLERRPTGPAFFPPIVAVLLPFKNKLPTSFPELLANPDSHDADGTKWQEQRAGSAFKVQRLLDPESAELHPACLGRLWWNSAESRLVVLDGQHRAMALLAVERTVSNSWADSTGAKYRSFYESEVQKYLEKLQPDGIDLARIEVPVTVCWFPEETGNNSRPHEIARKLFVDVNKEARPPSESRIILLSDAELINILTRRMLSMLRTDETGNLLPLFAVEYDNPIINSSRPARWSVVTNVHLLKEAVDWCIFGPGKLLSNVNLRKSRGRPNWADRDAFMREQLQIEKLFPAQFDDGGYTYQRKAISNTEFPLGKVDRIADQFASTWGAAILVLLSRTRPYAAHAAALVKMRADWHTDETPLTLAHDAMFGGVGVYWTLKDSYEHYQVNKLKQKSDVIVAWEALQKREEIFESYRAKEYLGGASSSLVKKSKAVYSVLNTQACQLGLVLALALLWELRRGTPQADLSDVPSIAESMVDGINAYFDQDHGKANDRRFCLSKTEVTHPLNQIQNMDALQGVYFRYFWLEILGSPVSWPKISKWLPSRAVFDIKLSGARRFYFDLLMDQQLKALIISNPGQGETDLKGEAEGLAINTLKKALGKWCDVDGETFSAWYDGWRIGGGGAEVRGVEDLVALDDDDGGDEDADMGEPGVSIDEFIEED